MADLVVVMGEGRICQAAPPVEVYRKPADVFVADFIGATNLIPVEGGRVLGQRATRHRGRRHRCRSAPRTSWSAAPDGGLTGRVAFVRDLGATVEVFVEVGDRTLTAVFSPREHGRVAVGDTVGVRLPAESAVVLR